MRRHFLVKRILAAILISAAIAVPATACDNTQVAGKSAYDIAVEHGFVGTETDWLNSLKGSDGTDGRNGTDGTDSQNLDIMSVYNAYLDNTPDSDITFEQFLQEVLSVTVLPGDTGNGTVEFSVNYALRSVVSIQCGATKTGTPDKITYSSAGSGVIYTIDTTGSTPQAYIITNYHVVYNESTSAVWKYLSVYTYGRESESYAMAAEYIGGSQKMDIAVIKITDDYIGAGFLRAADVQDSNTVQIGSDAIAVGNPSANGLSATSGMISAESEYLGNSRYIRTDAAVNPGNSGGGLFDKNGRLIGIVSAKSVTSQQQLADGVLVENTGYAIPSNTAVWLADNIISGTAKKLRLGIYYEISESHADYIGTGTTYSETSRVTQITDDTLADSEILVGDELVSCTIADTTYSLDRSYYLSDLLYKINPGDTFVLTVLRNGNLLPLTLSANLESYFDSL